MRIQTKPPHKGLWLILLLFLPLLGLCLSGPGPARAYTDYWGYYGQLTPEQQRIWQSIYNEYSGQILELRSLILAKKAELNALLGSSSLEAEKVMQASDSLTELRGRLLQKRVEMALSLKKNNLPFLGLDKLP